MFRKRITEMVRSHLWREMKNVFSARFLWTFRLGTKIRYRSDAGDFPLFNSLWLKNRGIIYCVEFWAEKVLQLLP